MLYGDTDNLLLNLKLHFDSMFLRDGHFTNVAIGNTVRSVDVSQLREDVTASNYFAGTSGAQVWQSPYQEWVYESGITMNDAPFISGMTVPVRATGISVNGTNFDQSAGVSGNQFYIDYCNGRVIFIGAGIPSDSQVQAAYTYRHLRVDLADKFAHREVALYAQTEFKSNPYSNNNQHYPSGGNSVGTVPAVFLALGEAGNEPMELGNHSAWRTVPVFCHVYTEFGRERNSAMDLINGRWHLQIPMVDFNYAPMPLSGLYNTLSPDYIPYQTLLENVQYNGEKVIGKYYIFDIIRTRPIDPMGDLERGIVEMWMDMPNIAPTGRIKANPYI